MLFIVSVRNFIGNWSHFNTYRFIDVNIVKVLSAGWRTTTSQVDFFAELNHRWLINIIRNNILKNRPNNRYRIELNWDKILINFNTWRLYKM